MEANTDVASARELDARTNDGVDVRLLWHAPSDRFAVVGSRSPDGELFALACKPRAMPELPASAIDTEPLSLHIR